MSGETIEETKKGHAFETKRIIMAPSTYPKAWRTRPSKEKTKTDGGE
jgi:H/ACA ribonucleoprotein complex subunit 4